MQSCTCMSLMLPHVHVCVCNVRAGKNSWDYPLQGVEFLGQSAQNVQHFIWDFLWHIHTFYRSVTGAFVMQLIATLKSGWRIYLWPQITVWLPRGRARRKLEHSVALNVGHKLYFTLSCVLSVRPLLCSFSSFFFLLSQLLLYLSIQEKLTHLSFLNNFANGTWV